MKTTEIREMSAAELDTKIAELKEQLFNLRFQMATGQCENPMKVHEVKKSIAQYTNTHNFLSASVITNIKDSLLLYHGFPSLSIYC